MLQSTVLTRNISKPQGRQSALTRSGFGHLPVAIRYVHLPFGFRRLIAVATNGS